MLAFGVALSFLASISPFVVLADDVLNSKQLLYSDGLQPHLGALDNLFIPPSTFQYVSPPPICVQHAQEFNCNVDALQAVSVTYNDCDEPWILCRCV